MTENKALSRGEAIIALLIFLSFLVPGCATVPSPQETSSSRVFDLPKGSTMVARMGENEPPVVLWVLNLEDRVMVSVDAVSDAGAMEKRANIQLRADGTLSMISWGDLQEGNFKYFLDQSPLDSSQAAEISTGSGRSHFGNPTVLSNLEEDLQIDLYPTSSLAEFHGTLSWLCREEVHKLEHELGRITDEEFADRRERTGKILDIARDLVDTMKELERAGAVLFMLGTRDGSSLEGYSGYVALLDGLPYYFADGDSFGDILSPEMDMDSPPRRLITEWRNAKRKSEQIGRGNE